jgi:glycosyltransferase involved in cell wall biosynthesis
MQKISRENEVASQKLLNSPAQDNTQLIEVLIPARNEEKYIRESVERILHQDYQAIKVMVIDDNSSDKTPAILAELKEKYPEKLKVIKCMPPPTGWVGKNNALWQGYQHVSAETEWLLFIDADTKLKPGTLSFTLGYSQKAGLSFLSLIPDVEIEDFWSKLLEPQIFKLYTFVTNNPANPPKRDWVQQATATGAFIFVSRSAYAAVGGHKSIKDSVIEDVALARLFRANGFNTSVEWGGEIVSMVPFEAGLRDLWESIGKNVFLAADKSWPSVIYTIVVEAIYGLLPFALLANQVLKFLKQGNNGGENRLVQLSALSAVAALLELQAEMNHKLKIPKWYAFLYPLASVITSALLIYSAFRVTFRRSVRWKGRDVNVV